LIESKVIAETTAWIKSVVIGCHFCPFAAKALQGKTIHFHVAEDATPNSALVSLLDQLQYLDTQSSIETTLIIFPDQFSDFQAYLTLVSSAEKLLKRHHYVGTYQIASFHPEYCFAGSDENDPANYTNRSIYPMLHILREESITNALKHYTDPEGIPQLNIDFARAKGLAYMQKLKVKSEE